MSHRKPILPFENWPGAPKRPSGHCRWCSEPILHEKGPKKGEVNKRRSWHNDCRQPGNIAISPSFARFKVAERDQEICADCGEHWSARPKKVRRYSSPSWGDVYPDIYLPVYADVFDEIREQIVEAGFYDRLSFQRNDDGSLKVCRISFEAGWAVDHIIPLWKVPRDIGWEQGRWYWSMENLQTLCLPCHDKKSAKEAAERAHHNELQGKNKPKSKRKWPSRPMSNPNLKRRMDGTVVQRQKETSRA